MVSGMRTPNGINRPDLVILVGLPGIGKSTFARTERFAGFDYVSKDQIRKSRKIEAQIALVKDALMNGRSVIVDNTNAGIEERAPLISLGIEYGARIIGYYFEPDVNVARERNRSRAKRVPDVAIHATRKRLVMPSIEEGFDEIHSLPIEPR